MKTKKGDFVELDFVASVKGGTVFDTTNQEEARKAGIFDERKGHTFKPIIVCIGEGMVIKGLDRELEDKEIGKDYEVEFDPKEAFGRRLPNLIKTVPLSAFKEIPAPGTLVNVDGIIAKVVAVTGGRALIDFNNPLAGKKVIYRFRINKIIEDKVENVKTLGKFFGLDVEKVIIKDSTVRIKLKSKADEERTRQFINKIKDLFKLEVEME